MSPWSRFNEFEQAYVGLPWIEFCRAHAEIPVFAVSAYLICVFSLPKFLEKRKPIALKKTFAAWNLALSLFSAFGATRTFPHLARKVRSEGIDITLCQDPQTWYSDGPVGLWMALFIFSKFPELADTLFLVLQKKRIIFLAWFHHATVLLYCWHAFHNTIGTGLWFATMNYAVHAVMYFYYFLVSGTGKKTRAIAKKMAPVVTFLQIAQMAAGAAVTARSGFLKSSLGPACHTDPTNIKLGLAMYSAYLVLFTALFWDKYFAVGGNGGTGKKEKEQTGADKTATLCGVALTEDVAGFFRQTEADEPGVDAPARKKRQ